MVVVTICEDSNSNGDGMVRIVIMRDWWLRMVMVIIYEDVNSNGDDIVQMVMLPGFKDNHRFKDKHNIFLDVDEVTKSLLSQCYEALDNNMGEVTVSFHIALTFINR